MANKYQDLVHFKLPSGFRGRNVFLVQLWWVVQSSFFSWSPQVAYSFRNFLLRLFGAKIGKNVKIRPSVRVTYPWKVSIGDNSWIGDDVVLYSLGEIKIGSNVVVSQKTYICTGSHKTTSKNFDIYSSPVILEDECWVATDVFIAPGIIIGKGAIVGARSSVFDDIPSGMICFGSPAKPSKERQV